MTQEQFDYLLEYIQNIDKKLQEFIDHYNEDIEEND